MNARESIKFVVQDYLNRNDIISIDNLRAIIQDTVYKQLLKDTGKRPLIVPLIVLI